MADGWGGWPLGDPDFEVGGSVDVDGRVDAHGVEYIGKATMQDDGTWRVLANVEGALCLVECRVWKQD